MKPARWRHLCVLASLLIAGCALERRVDDSPASWNRDSPDEVIIFQNISWAGALTIKREQARHVTWSLGLDQGGIGKICVPDEGMRCLVLDGLWSFSIPLEVEERPAVGSAWSFEHQKFQIVDSVSFDDSANGLDLLISSVGSRGALLFGYSRLSGLEYVAVMAPGYEEEAVDAGRILDWPMQSVWVNRTLHRCEDER